MTEAELPFVKEAIHSVQTQTCACELLVIVPEGNATILSYFRGFGRGFTLIRYLCIRLELCGIWAWRALPQNGSHFWMATTCGLRQNGAQLCGRSEDRQPLYWHASSANPRRWNTFLLRIRQTYADAQQLAGKTGSGLLKIHFLIGLFWEDSELWERIERKGVRTYTLKEYSVLYRVRHLSSSTRFSAPKHRKYRFARMSTIVGMRTALLISSRVWALLNPPLNTRRAAVMPCRHTMC
jgi:hypothetical protein